VRDVSNHFVVTSSSSKAEVAETRSCRNCGELGHIAKACTMPKKPDTRDCRVCGEVGHIARNCPSKPQTEPQAETTTADGGGGGGGKKKSRRNGGLASKRCFNCGQNGHLSADCPVPAGNTACYLCQQASPSAFSRCPGKFLNLLSFLHSGWAQEQRLPKQITSPFNLPGGEAYPGGHLFRRGRHAGC
jgi:cellular nucleic acid-binding protein